MAGRLANKQYRITPMQPDIKTVVLNFIEENFQYRARIESLSESQSLLEAGLTDSVGVLELVMFLESTFSIEVEDEEVLPENLDSIGAIVAFVRRKRAVDQGETIAHAR
jgi:acyl carrier protein